MGRATWPQPRRITTSIPGKFESLALKWAISDQFRDDLYYAPSSKVFTDNNPLIYVLSSAKLNATGLHWIGELADYLECHLMTELIQK